MKVVFRKRRIREYFLIAIYVILLFNQALQSSEIPIIAGVFHYIDEGLAVLFLIMILIKVVRRGYVFKLYDQIIFIFAAVFLVFGFICTFIADIQTVKAYMIDFFSCAKFFIGYFAARFYWDDIDTDYLKNQLNFTSRLISVVLFLLAINEEFINPLFTLADQRYFGYSIKLMFNHPTNLAACASTVLVTLAACSKKRENTLYMVMISVVAIFTFRSKVMAFIAVFWGLYLVLDVFKIRNRMLITVGGIASVYYIGYDQINNYYLTKRWSPRKIMLIDAVNLANKHFPFGMGYASFGTHMSVSSYSPIYYELGYHRMPGMNPYKPRYLNDGFWQAEIAQFGWVGTLIFVILIAMFFITAFKFRNKNIPFLKFNALLCINLFFLITSIGEMSYFYTHALLLFFIMGLIVSENRKSLDAVVTKKSTEENGDT